MKAAKLTNVKCYYTGGGIWVYSAKYGNVWLYGSFDGYISCLKAQGEKVYNDVDVLEHYHEENDLGEVDDPDSYITEPENGVWPTWEQLVSSLKGTEAEGWEYEIKEIITYYGAKLTDRINEEA